MIFRALYFHLFASQIMLPLALSTPVANNLLLFYLLPIANVWWSQVCGSQLHAPPRSPVNIVLQFNYFSFSCFVFFNRRLAQATAAVTATTTELTCMQHPPPLTALHKAHENIRRCESERKRACSRYNHCCSCCCCCCLLVCCNEYSLALVYLRSRAAKTVPKRCEWLGTVHQIKHL